jgi:hypothetical protein
MSHRKDPVRVDPLWSENIVGKGRQRWFSICAPEHKSWSPNMPSASPALRHIKAELKKRRKQEGAKLSVAAA